MKGTVLHVRKLAFLNAKGDQSGQVCWGGALGPVHTYSYENATFFLRFQKNSRPLVAFSHRFRPSTRIYNESISKRKLTRLRMLDAYVLKDKKGNKSLILRGVAWN